MAESAPHIAIIPSPGMGHLIPIVHLANLLALSHNLSVTIFIPSPSHTPPSSALKSILSALPSSVQHVFLPPAILPSNHINIIITLTVAYSLASLRRALKPLSVTALIADCFATHAFEVAAELGIPRYLFFPASALCLSLFLYLPELDATVSGPFQERSETIEIPGCFPINCVDLPDPMFDREKDGYRNLLFHARQFRIADGIMVNSFTDLESTAIKALQERNDNEVDGEIKPTVYPIGPVVKIEDSIGHPESNAKSSCECLSWLDEQPAGSVLFVSFGSLGTLSQAQMMELALGLETSGHRFLWVARTPNTTDLIEDNLTPFLPIGFLERIKGRGIVVPSWAPQTEVLSHGATGGFLSHCGWNSTLESLVRGVPMIAWPLYAEQRMNAVLLTSKLKVAIHVAGCREMDGVVGSGDVAATVRELMEGEEGKTVRDRARELKKCAAQAIGVDGSSTRSLCLLVQKWTGL